MVCLFYLHHSLSQIGLYHIECTCNFWIELAYFS
nr:MAG TPA: hypothetical protein [Caudoviricetes sp.]